MRKVYVVQIQFYTDGTVYKHDVPMIHKVANSKNMEMLVAVFTVSLERYYGLFGTDSNNFYDRTVHNGLDVVPLTTIAKFHMPSD
jgi:hypothetical protein